MAEIIEYQGIWISPSGEIIRLDPGITHGDYILNRIGLPFEEALMDGWTSVRLFSTPTRSQPQFAITGGEDLDTLKEAIDEAILEVKPPTDALMFVEVWRPFRGDFDAIIEMPVEEYLERGFESALSSTRVFGPRARSLPAQVRDLPTEGPVRVRPYVRRKKG
jgi:hypothetical protein